MVSSLWPAVALALALGGCAVGLTGVLLAHVARREPEEPGAFLPAPGAWAMAVIVTLAALAVLWGRPLTARSALPAIWTAALGVIFVVDLRVRYILDVFTVPLALLALLTAVTLRQPPLPSAVAGALIGLAFFGLLYGVGVLAFGRPAIGLGDVKLAFLLGLLLGAGQVLTALTIAIVLGGVVSLLLLLTRRVRLGDAPPYGTYLTLGAYVVLLQGAGVGR